MLHIPKQFGHIGPAIHINFHYLCSYFRQCCILDSIYWAWLSEWQAFHYSELSPYYFWLNNPIRTRIIYPVYLCLSQLFTLYVQGMSLPFRYFVGIVDDRIYCWTFRNSLIILSLDHNEQIQPHEYLIYCEYYQLIALLIK